MTDLSLLSFEELLASFFDRPGVEDELQRRHARTLATLVVDFSGMSLRTERDGIAYALALAAAAERTMRPAIAARQGTVVKREADTLFVAFTHAEGALHAALDAQRALAAFNAGRHGHVGDGTRTDPIHACMGLGWGPALLVPGHDLFGAEVNRAFILGEDTARPREVLCTEGFLAALGGLPSGVGAHRAQEEREQEAGFAFHVLGDWRE
jgi:class 3 adenylate cyclase